MAVAGLILGIISLICGFVGIAVPYLPFGTLILGIVGLVLSIAGGKRLHAQGQPQGIATAGLVIGIIAVVVNGITAVTCTICALWLAAVDDAVNNTAALVASLVA